MLIDLQIQPLSKLPLLSVGLDACGIGTPGIRMFRIVRGSEPMTGTLIDLKTKERIYFGYAYIGCGFKGIKILWDFVEFFAVVNEDFEFSIENTCLLQIIETEIIYRVRDDIFMLPVCKWFHKWHRAKMVERFSKYCEREIVLAAYKRFDELF